VPYARRPNHLVTLSRSAVLRKAVEADDSPTV
jgi:hypothetical protein